MASAIEAETHRDLHLCSYCLAVASCRVKNPTLHRPARSVIQQRVAGGLDEADGTYPPLFVYRDAQRDDASLTGLSSGLWVGRCGL
jgi:hypothetical protein